MITSLLASISSMLIGWPLIAFVVLASVICSCAFGWVQIRYFVRAWRYIFVPAATEQQADKDQMSPLQAFMNSLSISIGNGSLAGVATAVYAGGPGAIFWMAVIGLLLMAVRFAEVYASLTNRGTGIVGGPLIYIKKYVVAGRYVSYVYAVCALILTFCLGNAIQTNAIAVGLASGWAIEPAMVAVIVALCAFYILSGGAARIIRISDAIVPFKVILFFSTALIIIGYHITQLIPALKLIVTAGCCPTALAGGALGFSVQAAMRFGIFRSIFATEAGLGTSGLLFGTTESVDPMRDAIMSMISTCISTFVCICVGLALVMSGVWDSGLTSTALTTAAYQTVFGSLGSWLVTILAVSFGLGVLVAAAFIARTLWIYLFGKQTIMVFTATFCAVSFIGAMCNAHILWYIGEIVNTFMLVINISALLVMAPSIARALKAYR